jgi:DNA-binding SARP family transcriptional activator
MGGLSLHRSEDDPDPLMEAGRSVTILAYLALAPQRRIDRNRIAELLWPGAPLPDARHSLRQSLYRLREAADGTELVRSIGGQLVLHDLIRFDCLEGERAADAGDLGRAARLLEGDFLGDFCIPQSREFGEWVEAERSRFRYQRAAVLRRVANQAADAGDLDRGIARAEEIAGLAPFDGDSIRLQMSLLARAGRYATALARYQSYADLVRRELDQEPDDELGAYAREIEAFLKSRPGPSSRELPFVGRTSQWKALETAWQAAERGANRVLLVEGAAGFGKTRLLEELCRRVVAAGGLVLRSKCSEIEKAVPYSAVAEALAGLVQQPDLGALNGAWLAEASRLLPELAERFSGLPPVPPAAGSAAAKRRLHQALLKCVEAVAVGSSILLVVDDIHWADPPSLEVLHLLGHRLPAARLLVVASYRPAELSPVARQFARSLCADRVAELLALDALAEGEVRELLAGLSRFDDPALEADVASHLHRHSGGSPLFLSELLDSLARNGVLMSREGRWQIHREGKIESVPRTLGKLMTDRVDRLQPWMRACVEALAVSSQPVAVELLARALDLSEPRTELALGVLEEERLVKRVGSGSYELIHDELRKLVYQGVPDDRRRLIHQAIGLALEGAGEAKRPGGSARLAFHFDQAGERERVHRYALSAAGEAGAFSSPESRQAHLELAEAHAPRALPPGRVESVGARGLWDWWTSLSQRRWSFIAAALILLAVGAVVGGLALRARPSVAGDMDYRQATIYLGASGDNAATHQLRWGKREGELGNVEALPRHDLDVTHRIIARSVTADGETHAKLFTVRGKDTTQVTFGRTDDAVLSWAPDRARILVLRGSRAGAESYQSNLYMLDTLGRVVGTVTSGPDQDQAGVWSPTGTRLAFMRNADAIWSLWLTDADGQDRDDLSSRFSLPRAPGHMSFSPDGRRLAVVYPDTGSGSGTVIVLNLTEQQSNALLAAGRSLLPSPPLWSPDGRWLAYLTPHGVDQAELRMVPSDGSRPAEVVAVVQGMLPVAWTEGVPRYVSSVSVTPGVIDLAVGVGTRASVQAATALGDTVATAIRWFVVDTTVAYVDVLGFVRGRRAGSTLLVASAGGFRADTVQVGVSFAAVDTLFVEEWANGIDPSRWAGFGTPRSVVVAGAGPDGRSAFLNNGDYNHGSGVLSRARFEVGTEGLTLEAEGRLAFTGGHWQIWQAGLSDPPPEAEMQEYAPGNYRLDFSGASPTERNHGWTCGQGSAEWRSEGKAPPWHRFTIQVRPDGVAECYVDGRALFRDTIPVVGRHSPLVIMLRGHSVSAKLYHGRLVLTRGLRY